MLKHALHNSELRCADYTIFLGIVCAQAIGNAAIYRLAIILTTITIVIAIVSRPEFLFFKVWCRNAFGEAITSEHHEIFKLASKLGYRNI